MPPDDHTAAHLLRVTPDDPDYRRQAAAEAAFWHAVHPFGLETAERVFVEGPVERYLNARFTGDPDTDWTSTIARRGPFQRGLMLGISSPKRETRVLETNPGLHVTLLDISEGAVERRATTLGKRFGNRIATATADLNFLALPPARYDLIVSSSTIHHVTNLEHLGFQINRALTPDGLFFLEDYVGEPRFMFSEAKRRLYETLYERDIARQRGRKSGLIWLDVSDLSPFCGVRSDEILEVFRRHLDELEVRTAAALTAPMSRSRPADWDEVWARVPRWKIARDMWVQRLGFARRNFGVNPEFLEELCLVGDAACEAGLLRPGVAFAVYRKRRS
jgi:SAM-dependent methyltransferase